ncbi:MAG: rRNA maturation RNase YbeY [Clostridiaceae bacterium]|nr:rRNA maturation RNase YbeY [Clostridiaceae bacterium]
MGQSFLTIELFHQEIVEKHLTNFEFLSELLTDVANHVLDAEQTIKLLIQEQNYLVHIALSFLSKEDIKTINHNTRNIDSPTDVLSYPNFDFGHLIEKKHAQKDSTKKDDEGLNFTFKAYDFLDPDSKTPTISLGEILICPEIVAIQAKEIGNTFLKELCFLFVHGILHLCGYDHNTKEDRRNMFNLQQSIVVVLEELLEQYENK